MSMVCKRTATRRYSLLCAAVLAWLAQTARASADPIRLRADAVTETRAPAGLVTLEGQDRVKPWLDAEALVWAGARTDPTADILVLAFRLHAQKGWGELRGGRFVFTSGAIRPIQIDGAAGLARTPWGGTVEAFAGAPVVPRFGSRDYEGVAGGRLAQSIASRVTMGVSYMQRRARGDVVNDEVGADMSAVPVKWLDVAARSSYDLSNPGIAEALVSAAARFRPWRIEAFATHRSPSRLLPATSLFSVLGDFPSDLVGGTLRWDAAPRLDLLASGAGQMVGGAVGMNAWVRALLRLDDRGDASLGAEVRRQDVSTAQWTGLRGTAVQPIGRRLRFSTELELAFPDAPRGRGVAWPWGLMAVAWRSGTGWEAAAAVEAASTPEHRFEVNGLLRLSRALEIK